MCGICGSFSPNGSGTADLREAQSRAMLEAMRHRGPDGEQVRTCDAGAMGANRLTIRSLGDDLPPIFENEDGIIVACNGEIDNHRELRSQLQAAGHVIERATDIAVILPLYLEKGMSFVEHLRGVFAIAIWDPRQRTLLLARDRSGERHLYYSVTPDAVRFATELAALRAVETGPLEFDPEAIAGYVSRGYSPSGASPVHGCRKLRPGQMLAIQGDSVTEHTYWSMPVHVPVPVSHPDSVQRLDNLFREAVYRQTDADVSYGLLLSGGIDSSLLAAVAREVRPERHMVSYGIRFSENSFDESDHAARTAEALGYDFVPVTVTEDDLPGTLEDLIHTTGELLADPAWIPLAVLARRVSQDVRLVLSGEGADELFGGYPTYLGVQASRQYQRLPVLVRRSIRFLVRHLPVSDKKVAISFLLKRFVEGQDLDGLHRHILWTSHATPEMVHKLGLEMPTLSMAGGEGCLLDQVQRYDFEHQLPEALLVKSDRAGMRHGLEIRAPFLDTPVIDFACSLPPRARVQGLTTKPFLKQYAARYLPESTINRRKRGLSVPLASWLRGPLASWARTRLGSDALAAVGVDPAVALQILSEHDRREQDHSRLLWTLIVLSEWSRWILDDHQVTSPGVVAVADRPDSRAAFSRSDTAPPPRPPLSLQL